MTVRKQPKPSEQKPPEAKPESTVQLFEKHGPWWMLTALIAERFPYKTAFSIFGSLAISLIGWWVKSK